MAQVRNLKFNDAIVEQPYFNNKPLTKWEHNGVVVWENGGGGNFKDIYAIGVGFNCYLLSPKNKSIVYTIPSNSNLGVGLNNDFVWNSQNDLDNNGKFRLSQDISQALSQITTTGKKVGLFGKDDIIICANNVPIIANVVYWIKFDVEKSTYEILNTVDLDAIKQGHYSLDIFAGDNNYYKGASYDKSILFNSRSDIMVSQGYEVHDYIEMVDEDGVHKILYDAVDEFSYGNADIMNIYNKFYAVNGRNIYIAERERFSHSQEWNKNITTYFFILNNGNCTKFERTPIYRGNQSIEPQFLKNIAYDKQERCYVGYYDFSYGDYSTTHEQAIYKFGLDMSMKEKVNTPEYLDIPMQGLNNNGIRLKFSNSAPNSSTYINILANKYIEHYNAFYNQSGEIDDGQAIAFGYRDDSGRNYLIYIDNLYFNASENNFAIQV